MSSPFDRLQPGSLVDVHAYKHDGTLYRSWEKAHVLADDGQTLVVYLKFVWVFDHKKRQRLSRDDTFWVFRRGQWMNVQVTVRERDQLTYYMNVAGPVLVQNGHVKYIDYDLDFKLDAEKKWREVDMNEFASNGRKMGYPPPVVAAVKKVEAAIVASFRARRPIVRELDFLDWYKRNVFPVRQRFISRRSIPRVDGHGLLAATDSGFMPPALGEGQGEPHG